MGYAESTKGFRIYIPERNDVVISRESDVKVVEKMHYSGTPAEKREGLTPEPETDQLKFQKKETTLMRTYHFRNLTPFIPALVKIMLMNHLPQVEDHKGT